MWCLHKALRKIDRNCEMSKTKQSGPYKANCTQDATEWLVMVACGELLAAKNSTKNTLKQKTEYTQIRQKRKQRITLISTKSNIIIRLCQIMNVSISNVQNHGNSHCQRNKPTFAKLNMHILPSESVMAGFVQSLRVDLDDIDLPNSQKTVPLFK